MRQWVRERVPSKHPRNFSNCNKSPPPTPPFPPPGIRIHNHNCLLTKNNSSSLIPISTLKFAGGTIKKGKFTQWRRPDNPPPPPPSGYSQP